MSDSLRESMRSLANRVNVRKVDGLREEWGLSEDVYVREMSAGEFESFKAHRIRYDKKGNRKWDSRGENYELLILCACNAEGIPIFDQSDREWLKGLPLAGAKRIIKDALEINGLDDDEDDSEDGLDPEIVKNSDAASD